MLFVLGLFKNFVNINQFLVRHFFNDTLLCHQVPLLHVQSVLIRMLSWKFSYSGCSGNFIYVLFHLSYSWWVFEMQSVSAASYVSVTVHGSKESMLLHGCCLRFGYKSKLLFLLVKRRTNKSLCVYKKLNGKRRARNACMHAFVMFLYTDFFGAPFNV